ncbi:MAG TPA: hypothetical protein VLT62_02335 [Candidatus Methylomirabilis sp.]|nr:hypothetical protein [Candidatus Methylomirabilis sp.]
MEKVLERFVQDVQGLYAEDLLAILLYGSAASGEHVIGRSDLNVAIVLRRVAPPLLRKAAAHLRTWHRQGFATPMFFDPDFLQASLDVFAIEFLDMQERHRVLWGVDPFADLAIGRGNLRLQCEQELRGKLLRLRQSYVESAQTPSELERILGVAVSSLVVLARTLLRLGGEDPSGGADDILKRVQARFGVSSASLRKAWQVKRGDLRMTGAGLESLYQDVLGEVEGLVRTIDALPV